jgi:septal ring factor EnvC (AmiA/AmiB activator)
MDERKRVETNWIAILVTSTVILFATSMILYAIAENRKSDNEYFKGRLASLETRINQQDKRLDANEESLKKITTEIKDLTTLTIQINANVIENSKRLEDILNPPKPLPKKGKPKSAFKPEPLYTPPIQGPRPEPPPPRKTPYAIEGKQ